MLLTLFMIITSFPLNAFAAQTETNVRNEITDIRTVGDKQVINLGNVRGEKPQLRFFSRSARLFGATTPQARSSSETVAQKVEINLNTMGLNLEEDQFDPSALTEAGSFDVKITFKELGGTRTETRTMTFQAGEIKKTETFYLPKDFGNGNVEAEIPVLKDNIALRVYVGATGTTNFNLGKDMTYKFELTQIIHPVIGLKVVDPYGKELKENIDQDLGLKLALADEHEFDLPANTKTLNIRTLADFAGDGIEDLNSTGDNPTLSLTTALDKNKRLKVDDKTYKLNKITYKALGQEVEINGQKKKVGGYIEFATQPKIIVPTPDDSGNLPKTPDGYKRLSFHAETSANAQDGRFENGEKLKVIDVLEGTEYTDTDLQNQIKGIGQPTPIIYGRNDDNKKFLKWKPELPTTGPVADTDFRPVYLADGGEITPGEKLPKGVFEVKVAKDNTIAADPLYGKSYGVFEGSKLARDKFPDLEAEKGHQNPKWTTEAEDPTNGMVDIAKPWTKVITKATTFKATASKLPDIIENPTKPTPEGYVRVTFKAGEGVEDFKYAKTYDVKEGTALTTNHYPTAKAKVGYKDPKWSVAPGTAITSANATITATATKIEDIIPGGPEVKKPEGYYTVEFLEGKHGEFKPIKENVTEKPQVTVYYVNPEAKVKMSQITVPTVTAKVGYKFDSWSKEYQAEAVITGDRQITAVYIYVDGVSTEPKDGWTKVTLKSGTKGQFTKTTNVEGVQPKTEEFDDLVYYVDPAREVTIPAPVVKASVGNTFTGFDKSLTGTFKEETTINAKYLSTSDVIEDKTPGDDTEKPEGYVTVKFDAGQNGTFAVNSVTKFFVNPEKKVEIGAPGIDPNKNFVFTGFFNGDEKHSSAKKMYKQDVTYTAQYKDKSNESIIPGDQPKPGGWVTISFSAGEHGTFELVKGKQPTIAYHVNPEKDVVLKDKAPAIKANDGYKFTKYDPDVETARKYAKEGQVITAQYKAKVVTEDPKDAEHYAKVDFVAGDQGKFEKVGDKDQVTTFWVLKDEDVKFNAPVVTANDGFVFSGWNPALQTKYTEDKTHTAKYEPKSDISDVPVAGFQEVKFLAGTDGKFENDKTEKSVWVRPNVQVDLTTKAPKVIANKGKVHTGWKPSLIGTFTKSDTATVITAQYKTDADNNGVADETETTATPTVTARNIGENPTNTTVEGKAPKGSTVTIKYTPEGGQETTKTVTANEQGKYSADITPKLEAGKEVTVTAKDGEKKVSPEVKTQVFDDKDNDGKDDKSQNFDITKADKIEMVYDPANMNYLVTSEDGKVALETKGMVVKVTDKAGVEKKFTAEEIAKDTKNFKVEPKEGTEIGLANNDKPIKVTLNVESATTKVATTSNLSVKLDANGNGVDDEKEKLDLAKVTGIKIIKQPQLNYPITTEGGKTNINLSDMVVELTDGVNKANYTAQELLAAKIGKGQAEKAAFELELVQGSATAAPTTTAIEAVNKLELTTANDGNKVQIALAAKADVKTETEALQVFEDLDGDGKRDSKQTPAPKDLKALNKGDDTFTTITGKATKGDTLKVYGEDNKEITVDPSNITIDENGNFTIKVSKDNNALDPNTTVFVTAQAENKEESARIPVVVQVDKDGNGTADKDERTTIKSVIARNIGTGTTTPKTPATFTTIEGVAEPGSTVTIKFTPKAEEGQKATEVTKTVKANAQTGEYKLELKADPQDASSKDILLPAETEVKASAKFGDKKPSGEITTKVFEDLDADGKADNPNANKTERPSALAYNFKDETKTTIKGEAEPGAKVIAKVGKTIVGEATANSDGKYEISATKDNAKLPKGTKVSVTATLAPKGESPAQETVVYEDLDGDGQPDTSQAFDKDKIRGLEVVASPNKMVYNNKEQLNLTGMKVLLTDQMGNMKIVEFSEFQTYGIKVDPLNNIELSDKNVADGGHNGKKIKAEVKVAVGNSEKTYSGETPTALVVNKDQSAQPTDVEAANQGTKTTTTVRGKATPGAKVEVKNANGQVIGTVDQVPANGEFQVEVTKQSDKAKVKVTATEPGKAESAPQEAKVFRDKNGDWKDDKGGKVEIEKPVVDSIKVGDESVKVKIPGEGITKITVKDEKGKTIDVVKDGNDWKVDGKIVGKDGDKLVIPTKDKGLDFGAYEKVEITNHDDEGNEGKIVVATKPANLKPMEKPTIDPISTQSTKITGKSLPGSKVLVYLPGDTDETAREALVKSDGSYELTLATPLADKSLVKVKATNPQREGTGEAETKVGLNLQELEKTDAEADKLINDSKTSSNFDTDNNKYDKNLEEKSKAAKEVLKDAKDKDDSNDPSQTQVNTAEKELRDAINQKNADDKVKVVEKAVKDGQKPSEDQINEAQEAIDKVADTTAKKELQDRLDKAKLIDELKGKVDNAPKDDKDHPEYKTKPSDVIKALEDAKKEAEKVIKDYKDGTTIAEKTPEEAKKALDDAIADYNKEQVVVSFKRPVSGSKRLIIHSLQDYVTIEIYVAGQRKLETKTLLTSSVGGLTVTLEEALKSGQEVKIIGKKINLQDGESTLDVK